MVLPNNFKMSSLCPQTIHGYDLRTVFSAHSGQVRLGYWDGWVGVTTKVLPRP